MRIIRKSLQERLDRIKAVLPRSYVDATGSRPVEWANAPMPTLTPRVTYEDPAMTVMETDVPECYVQVVVSIRCGAGSCSRRTLLPREDYAANQWWRCPRCGVLSLLPEIAP